MPHRPCGILSFSWASASRASPGDWHACAESPPRADRLCQVRRQPSAMRRRIAQPGYDLRRRLFLGGTAVWLHRYSAPYCRSRFGPQCPLFAWT
ncbi:unnamed protein product (plasmid) [Mycetohabitans rhizoxinica HKI 454]|uniref:Uncharacterized protein n=1 Tax=Mycetohabitans rhizoxinica (strain DSM 19002 / CIP 109453 / HKI 454) TaxID=882378 RepID=E5AVN1_MYCRK|nr:unnamed protein product [Mycetohabitans rhizoxinica HKI 454]